MGKKGLWITLDAPRKATVTLTTKGGTFSFKLNELTATGIERLDGNVRVYTRKPGGRRRGPRRPQMPPAKVLGEIATERVKWSPSYQQKYGIASREATDLDPALERRIVSICKRVSRSLMLSGYARIDLRLTAAGEIYVMEANPNPHLASDEDYARSALRAGLDYRTLIARILGLGLQWEPGWLG